MNPLKNLFGGNSPNFMQFMQMMQNCGSPQAMAQMLLRQNPQIAQMFGGIQNQSPQQLEQIMRAMCAKKGIDYDSAFAQFQQMIGSKK